MVTVLDYLLLPSASLVAEGAAIFRGSSGADLEFQTPLATTVHWYHPTVLMS
jgi:hypothetical protein